MTFKIKAIEQLFSVELIVFDIMPTNIRGNPGYPPKGDGLAPGGSPDLSAVKPDFRKN